MPIPEAYPIREFLNYINFQKRYSRHTIVSYENDLTGFFDFVVWQYNSLELTEISASVVRSWLALLKKQKITSKSINRKISSLKSFFKYQLRTGSLKKSPMTGIISPKSGKRLPVYVEEKDMRLLTEQIDFPDTWQGRTESLLIRIFYNTG